MGEDDTVTVRVRDLDVLLTPARGVIYAPKRPCPPRRRT